MGGPAAMVVEAIVANSMTLESEARPADNIMN